MKKVLERTKKRVLAVLISAGVILGSLAAYTVAAADEGELTNLALGMPELHPILWPPTMTAESITVPSV